MMPIKRWLCLLTIFMSANVFAWGGKGHKVIAQIAWDHLTPHSQAIIQPLLKQKGFQSLAEAANWPDLLRDDPAYHHTKTWHYVNLPRQQTSIKPSRDCIRGCVLTALQTNLNRLTAVNSDLNTKAQALAFVVHLVGDMHQPLHVSFAFDKGGNSHSVLFEGKSINLHYYWDTAVLGNDQRWLTLAGKIQKQFSHVQQELGRYDDFYQWVAESHKLTQKIYAQPVKIIGAEKARTDQNVAYQRLAQAGFRTAVLLNRVFESTL
ncbi:S1/P1 nuclease [Alteromonadaceae bacterium BrNp21-10]|nr:S1/P1 nuclease [Alteromonadaceae bacterium BrNp21-10]